MTQPSKKKHKHCWHVLQVSTDIDPPPRKKCGSFPNAGFEDGIDEQCCKCGKAKL